MATLAPAQCHEEDLTDVCQQVELACVHIGSLHEKERTKASDILLALPQSPCLVDVVRSSHAVDAGCCAFSRAGGFPHGYRTRG